MITKNITQIHFSKMSQSNTDNEEGQSETHFLASPEPRPSKRTHWSKVHPGRGSRNFDPLGHATRIAGKGGAPEATHYSFGIGTQRYYRNPSVSPISKLTVIKNTGPGVKKAIREHNPAGRLRKLEQRLKSILKKPGQTKKPQKAINQKPKNPKSVIFDLVIDKSIWKKSKAKKSPLTNNTSTIERSNSNNNNQVRQENSE